MYTETPETEKTAEREAPMIELATAEPEPPAAPYGWLIWLCFIGLALTSAALAWYLIPVK